jgi:hypothetical protein
MQNQAANRFVKQLIAAYSRYPTSRETTELYYQKLSNWRLTQSEWDAALDKLLDQHTEENIPGLAEVTSALKSITTAKIQGGDYGFMYFNIKRNSFAVRLTHRDNVWVSVRTGKFFNPPSSATDILFVPDKQAVLDPHDIPNKDEIRKYCQQIESNLGLMP